MPLETKKAPPDLWAVWQYDQFPFYLCARVDRIDAEGYVKVDGYRGYRFRPVTLLYGKNGKDMQRHLTAARSAYADLEKGLKNAVYTAHRVAMTKKGIPTDPIPDASGISYPAFGAMFDGMVQDIIDRTAPAFIGKPVEDADITAPKVVDTPDMGTDLVALNRVDRLLKRLGL